MNEFCVLVNITPGRSPEGEFLVSPKRDDETPEGEFLVSHRETMKLWKYIAVYFQSFIWKYTARILNWVAQLYMLVPESGSTAVLDLVYRTAQ